MHSSSFASFFFFKSNLSHRRSDANDEHRLGNGNVDANETFRARGIAWKMPSHIST